MAKIILKRSELNNRRKAFVSEKVYPIDYSEEKQLYLPIKRIYFGQIEKGLKIKEYRDGTDHYKNMIFNRDKKTKEIISYKNITTVLLQEGYNSSARRMIVEVKIIEFRRDFTIHLGQILERINF